MNKVPDQPKIYHITHVQNLQRIIQSGYIWSDRERLAQELDCQVVGMPRIKQRRLEEIEVSCNPGTKVGDYVPFYLCPRSVMLYIFFKKNHPDLPYREGQEPIVHLVADMNKCARWANEAGIPIAFSTSNAGSFTADFYSQQKDLDKIDWRAVTSRMFRDPEIRERKQAEFLMYRAFPWQLIERIGVFDDERRSQVSEAVATSAHQPEIKVENSWYY